MARQESPRVTGKLELVATLDRTRSELSRDLGGMGRALDLSTQFRRSYASGSWRWLAGALAVGVVAGLRFLPTPKANSSPAKGNAGPMAAGVAGMILRQLFMSAAQPALTHLLGQEIEKWLSGVLRKP